MTAAADVVPAPALEVRDLEVTFATADGPVRAVAGASLDLAPGRTLGLVGESGCGKSMTALAVLGLLPPPGRVTAGEVRLGDERLTGRGEAAMAPLRGARVAMVFQEPMTALNPVMTVGNQIAEAWSLHHEGDARAARAVALSMLRKVRMPEPERRLDSYPHQLSGGMRQRAMIATALACGPEVLIADEPTTALDVTIQSQILDLMLEMQAEYGMAMLFISHNLGVVSEIADEIAVMYAGRVVERAAAPDIFANARHPYTRALIATVPRIGERLDRLPAIPGTVPDPRALPPGCPFSDRCPRADAGCRAAEPPLEAVGGGHLAACFKAEEGAP